MSLTGKKCVVLNASYEPLSIISAKRAIILVYEDKADIIEEYDGEWVTSPSDIFPIPKKILLKKMVKSKRIFRTPAILNQNNLFIRDNHTCQYCGTHRSELSHGSVLTRDHVHPRSMGGKDIWENVVTACSECNGRKDNHLPNEVFYAEDLERNIKMTPLKTPNVPTIFEIWSKSKFKKI